MSAVKKPGGPNDKIPAPGVEGPDDIQKANPNKLVAKNAQAKPALTEAMQIAITDFLPLTSAITNKALKEGKISSKKVAKGRAKVEDTLAEINFGVRNVNKGPFA